MSHVNALLTTHLVILGIGDTVIVIKVSKIPCYTLYWRISSKVTTEGEVGRSIEYDWLTIQSVTR